MKDKKTNENLNKLVGNTIARNANGETYNEVKKVEQAMISTKNVSIVWDLDKINFYQLCQVIICSLCQRNTKFWRGIIQMKVENVKFDLN